MQRIYDPFKRFEKSHVVVGERKFLGLFPPHAIHKACIKVAKRVRDYIESDPHIETVFLVVLKGATPFATDMMRLTHYNAKVLYCKASSYHGGTDSIGEAVFNLFPKFAELNGRRVVIIEDIVDTGCTLAAIKQQLRQSGVVQTKVATLLDKPSRREVPDANPDWYGFQIPDLFVIGYGMDYQEQGRTLPGIYSLDERRL